MGVRDGEKYIKLENLESFEVGGFEGQVALGGGYNHHHHLLLKTSINLK